MKSVNNIRKHNSVSKNGTWLGKHGEPGLRRGPDGQLRKGEEDGVCRTSSGKTLKFLSLY